MRKIATLLPLAFLTALLVVGNYFLLKTITSRKPVIQPKLPSRAEESGKVLKTYAAEFMNSGENKNVTREQALEQAKHFDLIAPQLNTYDRETIAAMKAANPRLMVLVYDNAAYHQQNEGPGTSKGSPEAWYAKSSGGCFLRSKGFSNWLMDTSHEGWVNDRANDAKARINERGFDGVIYDLLGIAPVRPNYNRKDGGSGCSGSGVPAKPSGGNWTRAEWLNNMKNIARRTKEAVGDKIVAGNGLDDGSTYFDVTKGLFDVGDIMMAETWLRNAPDPIGRYPNESQWKKEIDMLSDAGAQGKTVLVMVKVWDVDSRPAATQEQKEAWHKFSLASFLLGTDGKAMFSFRYDHGRTMPHPWWDIDIGQPTGEYQKTDNIYHRTFTNGMALVNPTDQDATFPLPKTLKKLSGEDVSSVSLPKHTGEILLGEASRPTKAPVQSGLTGFYYSLIDFTGLESKTDREINFDFVDRNNFGSIWVGKLSVPQTGEYTFFTELSGVADVWIDGNLIVSNSQDIIGTEYSGRATLSSDQQHDIKIFYYTLELPPGVKVAERPASMKLLWSGPGINKQIVPSENLSPFTVTP